MLPMHGQFYFLHLVKETSDGAEKGGKLQKRVIIFIIF